MRDKIKAIILRAEAISTETLGATLSDRYSLDHCGGQGRHPAEYYVAQAQRLNALADKIDALTEKSQ